MVPVTRGGARGDAKGFQRWGRGGGMARGTDLRASGFCWCLPCFAHPPSSPRPDRRVPPSPSGASSSSPSLSPPTPRTITRRSSSWATFCAVKWMGVELGRTRSIAGTAEPDWGQERFGLDLAELSPACELPLAMEVWAEDELGIGGDFLGRVSSAWRRATRWDRNHHGDRGCRLGAEKEGLLPCCV